MSTVSLNKMLEDPEVINYQIKQILNFQKLEKDLPDFSLMQPIKKKDAIRDKEYWNTSCVALIAYLHGQEGETLQQH